MFDAFITGGSGFLGGHLIRFLREKDWNVRALARSEASARKVESLGAKAVRGDLSSQQALQEGMLQCKVVFHCAARAEHWGRRADFWQDNVQGTQNVIDAAIHAGVGRLVHTSTEAVYVGGEHLRQIDEARPLPQRSKGLYPESKAEAEKVVRNAHGKDGLTTVILRPRLIWGPHDTSVLAKLVEAVESGQFAWIDQGRYLTSTCHVRNVCQGLLLAATSKEAGGETYFLTDGAPIEVREFLTRLLASQGIQVSDKSYPRWLALTLARICEPLWRIFPLPGIPPVTYTAVQLLGQEVTVLDEKARRELGYHPIISLEEGLQEMERASA